MEAFNVIPLFVGPLYQKALLHFAGDKTDAMVTEGLEAVAEARMMRQKVQQVKNRVEKNHQDFDDLIAALDYEINLFDVLSSYRRYFLNYYKWVASGDAAAYQAWKERLQDFQVKEEDHSPEHSCRHTGSSALCRLGLAGAGLLIMLFSRRKSGDRD